MSGDAAVCAGEAVFSAKADFGGRGIDDGRAVVGAADVGAAVLFDFGCFVCCCCCCCC